MCPESESGNNSFLEKTSPLLEFLCDCEITFRPQRPAAQRLELGVAGGKEFILPQTHELR